MKFTVQELTRFIGYCAGILVGLGFVAFGLATGDVATAISGAGMLGLGAVAAPNVSRTELDYEDDDEDLIFEVVEDLELPGNHSEE